MRRVRPHSCRFARAAGAGEAGFALPAVLFMTLAAFAIASIGITASIGSERGTSRDHDTKDALAVAEAGTQQTLLRYNAAGTRGACATGDVLQSGWCHSAGTVNGVAFDSWVLPTTGPDNLEIVSQATSDGATRRVHVTASSAAGSSPFLDAGIVGKDSIGVDSNGDITGDMATNGDITLANGSGFICGNAQVGVGHVITNPSKHTCGGTTYGEFNLPAVNQGDVRTNNQNSNFFSISQASGHKPQDVCFNGKNGVGAASTACGSRELYVGGNAAVTLQSGNYSFCKMTTESNSNVYIAAGSVVRIYFDSPESCGYTNVGGQPIQQLSLNSNGSLTVNGTGGSTDFAMLFVGSDSRSTSINLASNTSANQTCNQNFVIYAPRSIVNMASNSYYCGAIAGKAINAASNAHISASNLATQFQLPNAPAHYTASRFVECAAVPTATVAKC
jgi:hypothetical protein